MQGKHDLQKVTNRSLQKIQDILLTVLARLENFNMSVKKKKKLNRFVINEKVLHKILPKYDLCTV